MGDEISFRSLMADEIECRVGQVSKYGKGLSLLLYKDARCDANVLDETVGPENWQCEFYECKGTLFCKVGILIDRGEGLLEWVWKDDAGSPSNMEAEKGEASDAFKRACFKWGLGRELYTAPFIWVRPEGCNLQEGNGKYFCNDRFSVAAVVIENHRIESLSIRNDKTGNIVFSWPNDNGRQADGSSHTAQETPSAKTPVNGVTSQQRTRINVLVAQLAKQRGVKYSTVKEAAYNSSAAKGVGIESEADMRTSRQAEAIIGQLEAWVAASDKESKEFGGNEQG